MTESVEHVDSGTQLAVTPGQVVDHLGPVSLGISRRRLQLVAVAVHDVDAVLLQRLHVANQRTKNTRRLTHPHSHRSAHCISLQYTLTGWWRGTVVERRSLAGELSLSCARPAADG